jgi:hypothetical protein
MVQGTWYKNLLLRIDTRCSHIPEWVAGLQENEMTTDRENGRGNKRARVTRGSRNPKHGKRKHYNVHKPSRLN